MTTDGVKSVDDDVIEALSSPHAASLLACLPDAVFLVDSEGVIRVAGGTVEALFGYAADELVGRPVELLVPDVAVFRHGAHRQHSRRQPQERLMGAGAELQGRHKDGSILAVDVTFSPPRGQAGAIVVAVVRDTSAQRAAVNDLGDHERRLRLLMEQMPGILLTTDTALLITSIGGSAIAALEAAGESRIGGTVDALVGPCEPGDSCPYRSALDGRAVAHRWERDGRCFEGYVEPLHDDAGAIIGTIDLSLDVTDRVNAVRAASDAQSDASARAAQLEALTRAVPSAVWSHAIDGALLFANDQWREFTGQPSSESAYKGWREVIHPEDLKAVAAAWAEFEAGPATGELRHTFRVRHATTGVERTLKEHAVFALSAEGHKAAVVGATHDITDEANAARTVRRQLAELEALTATLPTVVSRFELDGTVTYCSEQWRALTGRAPESALGDGWEVAVHPDDLPELRRVWDACIASSNPYRHEYRVRHVDGTVRWVLELSAAVFDDHGAISHWVLTSVDVTDQHAARSGEQARAAQQTALASFGQIALNSSLSAAELEQAAGACVRDGLLSIEAGTNQTDRIVGLAHAPIDQLAGAALDPAQAQPRAGLSSDEQAFVGTVAQMLKSSVERNDLAHQRELSPDLVCTAGFDGYFKQINRAWVDLLGHSEQALLERPYLEFVHPDDQKQTRLEAARLAEGNETVRFQNRYRARDGSYKWLEWHARASQQDCVVYSAVRDVTAQHDTNELIERMLAERTRDLDEARVETLRRLALAAEYRDDDTYRHTERVGHIAGLIAEQLGQSADFADLIRKAAPLHDVGKLAISDTILLKPGKLTSQEFERMQSHTTAGARILRGSRSDILQMAEEIALTHHERWDGNGYPNRLNGNQIPLTGRIVAVADVFDALTHKRPYKRAWPLADALAEITTQSGHQFDPDVVTAFRAITQREHDYSTPREPLQQATEEAA